MAFVLHGITLPSGLYWADKFEWTPVSQNVQVSLTGTLVIQEAAQLAGRLITLKEGVEKCWLTRSELDTLDALTAAAGATYSLNLGVEGTHTVMWTRTSAPIVAIPAIAHSTSDPTTKYMLQQLNFIDVG